MPADGGQAGDGDRDALVHELAGLEAVGAALEEERDGRQAGDGLRAHDVEPRRAVQRLLHRDRDQLLDLLRGHAEPLGLHLDERRRELGEDVDRHVAHARRADDQHAHAERHHDEAELQARPDDPPHHRIRAHSPSIWNSVPSSSWPPTLTTWVPTGRPALEDGDVAVDLVDLDRAAHERERPGARVHPRAAVDPVDDGRVGDGLLLPAAALGELDAQLLARVQPRAGAVEPVVARAVGRGARGRRRRRGDQARLAAEREDPRGAGRVDARRRRAGQRHPHRDAGPAGGADHRAGHDQAAVDLPERDRGRLEADPPGRVGLEHDPGQVGVLDALDLRRPVALLLGGGGVAARRERERGRDQEQDGRGGSAQHLLASVTWSHGRWSRAAGATRAPHTRRGRGTRSRASR